MTEYNPKIIDVKTLDEARHEIKQIGSDPGSINIIAPKAISKVIKLEVGLTKDTAKEHRL